MKSPAEFHVMILPNSCNILIAQNRFFTTSSTRESKLLIWTIRRFKILSVPKEERWINWLSSKRWWKLIYYVKPQSKDTGLKINYSSKLSFWGLGGRKSLSLFHKRWIRPKIKLDLLKKISDCLWIQRIILL